MKLTASRLRENVYRILDRIVETGEPVEIERRGKVLRIELAAGQRRLDRLKPVNYLLTDPEELIHLDWSSEWRP